MEPDNPVSHRDILDRIDRAERLIEKFLAWVFVVVAPMVLGAALWVWQSHTAQAGFNAETSTKLADLEAHHSQTQQRIESRLDEITRFLREDSKELREALRDHIDSE